MENNLYQSLAKAQSEMPLVTKTDNNPFFKSKYAGLPSILEVALPVLHKNGLFIVQCPITNGDRIGIKTDIYHTSGDSISSEFTVALQKNDPQGAGSALTYCRRYALVAMLGLNVDEDDDANHASGNVSNPTELPTIRR